MRTIVFLFDGNFEVSGHVRHYKRGELATMPAIDAERLITGLCAVDWDEHAEEKPEPIQRKRKPKEVQ